MTTQEQFKLWQETLIDIFNNKIDIKYSSTKNTTTLIGIDYNLLRENTKFHVTSHGTVIYQGHLTEEKLLQFAFNRVRILKAILINYGDIK